MTTPGENDPANRSEPPSYGAYAYPGSETPEQLPQVQRGPLPPSVDTASKTMVVGAIVSVLLLIVNVATISTVRTYLDNQHKYSSSKINSLVAAGVATEIILGLIGAGLWLWMAWATRKGHSWARIVSTVFFAIGVIGAISGLAGNTTPGWERAIGVIPALIGLVAIIFLWKKESTAYFKPGQPR